MAEEVWKFSCLAFSYQYFYYFMAFLPEVFFQCEGLCEMSSAFSLYDE